MADFTDGYMLGYQCLMHVYDGVLQPQNAPVGVGGPFTGVKYRIVDTEEIDSDSQTPGDDVLRDIETFEIWVITLNNGGYMPKAGDLFTDVDGKTWTVIKHGKEDLRNSNRLPPTIRMTCWRKQ